MSSLHSWEDGGGPRETEGVPFGRWDGAQDGDMPVPRDSTWPAFFEDRWFGGEATMGRLQVSFKRASFLIR